ncbi:PF07599 family protein, partial [Leptospira interrogans serovar Pomona str. Kennewicki LC82-25]
MKEGENDEYNFNRFLLLKTLENLYTTYVEYFLKQTFLDSMQKISKTDQKQNEIPVLPIF